MAVSAIISLSPRLKTKPVFRIKTKTELINQLSNIGEPYETPEKNEAYFEGIAEALSLIQMCDCFKEI